MLSNSHSKRLVRSLTQCRTAAVLLCVYLGTLNFSYLQQGSAASEVFCPLQKTWVKKNPASVLTEKQREPLKDICASDSRKSSFLSEFIESLRFTQLRPTNEETVKVFFAYFNGGKAVFKSFVSSHNTPEPQFISQVRTEKSAKNSGFDFVKKTPEILSFSLQPRPPTVTAADNFIPQTVIQLKNISRRISPRAPPVHI
jgi:hypothetical protein